MHQQRQINIAALITRGTGMNTQILSPEEHIRVIEANDGVVPEQWLLYEEFVDARFNQAVVRSYHEEVLVWQDD
jgi:hypothetical protein